MEEYEINLVEMFRVIFRKFGNCVIAGLLVAVTLGGYRGFDIYRTINDPELLAKAQAEYEKTIFDYEREKETLAREIDILNIRLVALDEYLGNSVKMQLDPYSLCISRNEYLIDTHYQVMPDKTYQDVDKTSTVVNTYRLMLSSSEFYKYIQENMSIKTDEKYLSEIIKFSNLGNGIISIEVEYLTEKDAKRISEYVLDFILMKKVLVDEITEHDISTYSTTLYSEVDESLATYQESKITSYQNMMYNLQEKELDLLLLEEPDAEEILDVPIIKEIIKFGIIGFLAGGVLLGMLFAFEYLFNTKVCNEKEFYDRYKVRVFGSVNVK
ncbi:MAG: hypothetical protein IKM20_08275 [Erysipelotrichales bacterium]|nr:hypothetical protein [Erysipelotrichales bacterium]